MPAALSENGFMDNKSEAMLMINAAFQKEVASKHAKGICDYFGVPYKGDAAAASTVKITPGIFRIRTGTFRDDASAEAAAGKIERITGFEAFPQDKRAWTGTFSTRESAEIARALIAEKVGMNPEIRDESA